VTVESEFDFVCAIDGSKHTVKTFGEAMDSGDKATNKAMSAAYKYAAFQAFSIPTEGDNDADAHTPQVAAAMPADVLADWISYVESSTTVGELKAREAEAHKDVAADPVALAKIQTAIDNKRAKARPQKEAA
jgi:hypothetical protein